MTNSSQALGFVSVLVPSEMTKGELHFPAYINVRYDNFVRNLFKPMTEPFMALHAALGVSGEAGELADAVKKEYIYMKPRDRGNIVEELGDLRFYIQAVQNHYEISDGEVLQKNADKLSKRYVSLKYSDEEAIERKDKEV